jgi:hypothetical protein
VNVEKILEAFHSPKAAPEEAITAALGMREELAPIFLNMIAEWNKGEGYPETGYYYLTSFAVYLLAEWREKSAFKPVLRLLATPQSDDLLGDSITEDGALLLVNLYDGDRDALENLALDEEADEFVREQALDAYVRLTQDGEIPRDIARTFLERLLAEMPRQANMAWIGVVDAVSALTFAELVPGVKRLFDEGVADTGVMDYEDFEDDLREAQAGSYPRRRDRGSPADVMRRWRYPGDEPELPEDGLTVDEIEALAELAYQGPAVNEYRDVGRNDPCPCGSGKKFKKCCLPNLEAGEI